MCKLVVIDDNPIEHLIMQRMLNRYELFPDTIHSLSGKMMLQFLEQYSSRPDQLPDIIFLDLNMPGFSGWDFLMCFKKIYPTLKKSIDVYIISSSIDPKDKLRSEEYIFIKDYICKPVKKETLMYLNMVHKRTKRLASNNI